MAGQVLATYSVAIAPELDKGFRKSIEKGMPDGSKQGALFGKGFSGGALKGVGALGVAAGNVLADAFEATAGKVGSLFAETISAYGDYEQLQGGAELMFGEGYELVAEKAKDAYRTVQLSQNEYLEQVNGFAVGLKTALGGNEKAAAELADRIITAEADVVSATGNSQEAVQNAFNGIMKSNFTMVDNLGLGITPTKEGFQEMIDAVNAWNEANGRASDYVIDNLADCQSALVDYIEMQGLAGYAAGEAADTIQGSLSMARSAWDNLLAGLADENADVGALVDALVGSAGDLWANVWPRVELVGTRLATELPRVVAGAMPAARDALVAGFGDSLEAARQALSDGLEALPEAVEGALSSLPGRLPGLTSALSYASQRATMLGATFHGAFEALRSGMSPVDVAARLFENLGMQMSDLGDAASDALVGALSKASQAVAGLRDKAQGTPLAGFAQKLAEAAAAVSGLAYALNEGVSPLGLLKAKLDGLPQPLKDAADAVGDVLSKVDFGGWGAMLAAGGAFGALQGPVKAAAGALGTFGTRLAPLLARLPSMSVLLGGVGPLFAGLAAKARTFGSAVALMGGGFKGFAAVLGGVVRGGLASLGGALGAVVSPIGLATAGIAALVAGFAYMMATDEGFRAQMAAVAQSIGESLLPVFETLKTTLAEVASAVLPVITQAAAQLAPVFGQVALVIAQLLAAIMPVVTTVLSIVIPIIGDVITMVVDLASTVLSYIIPVVESVLQSVSDAMPTVQAIIETVMGAVQNIVEAVWPVVQSVIETAMAAIGAVIDAVWPVVQTVVETAMAAIQDVIGIVLAAINGDWEGAWNGVKDLFSDVWEGLKSAAEDGISALGEIVGGVKDTVLGFFDGAGEWLSGIGKSIIDGLTGGIEDGLGWLGDQLGSIGDFIVQHKGPPSYDAVMLEENGSLIVQSLANGMQQAMAQVEAVVEQIKALIVSSFAAMPEAGAGLATLGEPFAKAAPSVRALSTALAGVASALRAASNAAIQAARSLMQGRSSAVQASGSMLQLRGALPQLSSAFRSLASGIASAMQSALASVRSAVSAMQSAVNGANLKVDVKSGKVPHYSWSGKFDPETKSVPTLNVSWYAKGGIFNAPSVIGVGEAGPEAVVPIAKLGDMLGLDGPRSTVNNYYTIEGITYGSDDAVGRAIGELVAAAGVERRMR